MHSFGHTARLLTLALSLPLAACGGKQAPATPAPTTPDSTAAAASATPSMTMAADSERVAFIVAVVGDSAITNVALFDAVVQRYALERRQPEFEGPEAARMKQEVLQDEITELMLLQAALKDTTIVVSDDKVRQGVDQQVQQRQREVGGPAQFERALLATGSTLAEFREYLGAELRRNEVIRQYLGKVRQNRQPPPATDKEIRDFFEQNRTRLVTQWGPKPALVTVDQVILPIQPSAAADSAARARIDSAYVELRAGGEWDAIVRRYSDEELTKDKGGDLGWIQEGTVVREFARVAFSLPPGAYSFPVRTSFGWHIIKAERARGGEAHVRHILVMPKVTEADVTTAQQRGDSIANLLRNGEDAAALARQFGDPEYDARVGPITATDYEKTYITLTSTEKGAVVGPTSWQEGPRRRFVVARITESTPAGEWSLEDQQARDYVERTVEDEKLMDELTRELRRSIYVKVLEQ